jgi:hypothetical protein
MEQAREMQCENQVEAEVEVEDVGGLDHRKFAPHLSVGKSIPGLRRDRSRLRLRLRLRLRSRKCRL